MMCPDCCCELNGSENACPNCGHIFRYPKQPIRHVKTHDDLLEEQNRLLKSIDASQKTTAAYTMLNVFWH